MRQAILSVLFATLAATGARAAGTLTVYAYDGFTAEWGPGPQIEAAFESRCGCDLTFVTAGDGVALLNKARLEGDRLRADIVLGLDMSIAADARATGLFVPHGIALDGITVPGGFDDDLFVPFDYGWFAVVYDSTQMSAPPSSLKELVEGDEQVKIVIEDPRSSTPGLGLVTWMKAVYGEEAGAAWARLKRRVLTVAPGWSEAYGLFTAGEAPMVLSYTTSPAYHLIAEGSDRYRAAAFAEGHYLQVEVAAMTKNGAANPLAAEFLRFMVSPAFQDVIPETNWMYPAGRTEKPLPAAFAALARPERTLYIDAAELAANREKWIAEWLDAMSR